MLAASGAAASAAPARQGRGRRLQSAEQRGATGRYHAVLLPVAHNLRRTSQLGHASALILMRAGPLLRPIGSLSAPLTRNQSAMRSMAMSRFEPRANRYINRYTRLSMALNRLAVLCNGCIDVTVVFVAQTVGMLFGM